ncbi:NADPH-dependent oxidoreductase [Rhodococcus sp. Eu-32]|uniref:NADPH-dependent oxidoreductase n=1 Tax=Rhodococcus sp. Eu-32 TaxID=1017319 RepID=UPI000DF4A818|nr:NADPH-dependent oxidoreductase [Rhodococcus sp. Eu-32]RRQ29535.1 NADPH-dependent oxidoreductase [Rhodococcus sp. Eu-32]
MTSAPTNAAPVYRRYRNPDLTELAHSNDTLDVLLRHHSVRNFSPEPIDTATLETIAAAAQSAPTSSNLQAWSVVAVRETARKSRLASLAGDQGFIAQAPVFLVFVADLGRARRLAERHDVPLGGADYLESTLLGFIDAALAAQNAVVAAESLGLGTVYVGAVRNNPEAISDELGLPPGAFPVFGLAIGRPDGDSAGIKPRLPLSAVLHHDTYDSDAADAGIAVYDERLAEYNREQGRESQWTTAVLSRLRDASSLKGRDRIRDALASRGWPSR